MLELTDVERVAVSDGLTLGCAGIGIIGRQGGVPKVAIVLAASLEVGEDLSKAGRSWGSVGDRAIDGVRGECSRRIWLGGGSVALGLLDTTPAGRRSRRRCT